MRALDVRLGFVIGAALLATLGGTAEAATSPWAEADWGKVRLVTAVQSVGTRPMIRGALEVQLAPGWKTYWRSPGEAGAPPQIEWTGSVNLAQAEMRWPAPERFSASGIQTVGYHGHIAFPLDLAVRASQKPVSLVAELQLLLCGAICMPASVRTQLDLPAGEGEIDIAAASIVTHAQALVPDDGSVSGLMVGRTSITPGNPPELLIEVTARDGFSRRPEVLVESPQASFATPNIVLLDSKRALAKFPISKATSVANGTALRVTVIAGDRSAEISQTANISQPGLCVASAPC